MLDPCIIWNHWLSICMFNIVYEIKYATISHDPNTQKGGQCLQVVTRWHQHQCFHVICNVHVYGSIGTLTSNLYWSHRLVWGTFQHLEWSSPPSLRKSAKLVATLWLCQVSPEKSHGQTRNDQRPSYRTSQNVTCYMLIAIWDDPRRYWSAPKFEKWIKMIKLTLFQWGHKKKTWLAVPGRG